MIVITLKTLWVQRNCSYEGEYAPECVCATDEYSIEDNEDWFDEQCRLKLEELGNEISSHLIIDIELNQEQLAKMLNDVPTIKGDIKQGDI